MTLECIASVGNHPEVEIIVVDDGSAWEEFTKLDSGLADIGYYKPSNWLYRNESNLGFTKNTNRCMSLATGEWMCLIGSDDYFKPDAVKHMVSLLRRIQEVALLVYSRSISFTYAKPGAESARNLRLPSGSGNMWHRKIYEDLGGFDERLKFSPDCEYWYRIAAKYPVIGVPERYCKVREHDDGFMWSTWRQPAKLIEQMKLVTRLNMVHKGFNTDDNDVVAAYESDAIWDTITYIMRKTSIMPSKHDIFDMYLPKAETMAVSVDRKELLRGLVYRRNQNGTKKEG
jgi:glycosyltransferase involved in cell wall biosynthesis